VHRSWQRPVLTLLATIALAASGTVALATPAQAADTDIKVNEVESNGGTPGDWIEVTNIGANPVDIGGFGVLDNDSGHAKVTAPAGTMLNPGAFYVFDTEVSFGLGGADSANLYAADGTTLLNTYSWTSHAASTYGRCPDGTGAFTDTTSTRGAANSCAPPGPPIKINEVESDGGIPGDWIELANPTGAAYDASGMVLKDDTDGDPAHAMTLPAGSSVPATGYLAIDVTFGLGSGDQARLFATDGTTVVDSYTWAAHATTTYGRCPDTTGAFTTTQVVTKGAKNICPGDIVADPWPGGSTVSTVDVANTFPSNLSGLTYVGTGSTTPGTIWAVRNGSPEALYKLVKSGSDWVPDTGDWATGKQLRYNDGTGNPDAEGVTFTDGGPAGGAFVSTERNNGVSGTSRPAILRFDPNAAGTSLNATNDWNLSADLPGLGANLGLEGIAWVPDSYLTAKGFTKDGGAAYVPADFPNHGAGLFFVGVEQNGMVYAYALDLTSNSYTRVASFASGFPAVMELHFEKETQKLWVVCDDSCQGRSARFDVETAAGPNQGKFVPVKYYERPTGMANLNNEGFTATPRSECVGGVKPVFWADDGNTGGHALRAGTLNCTNPAAQTVTFSTTAPSNPVVGQTYTPAASSTGGSGNPVVISIAAASAGVCSLAAGVVTFDHPGSCVVKADQAGSDEFAPGSAQQSITVLKANTKTLTKPKATTIEATVSVLAPGAGSPTGTVLFAVDGTNVGSAPLAGGTATLTYTVPHDGATHDVTAAYQGNADFNGSSSLVGRADPTITASLSGQGPSAAGWYRSPVTVSFTCTPHGSALTTDCPAPVTLSASGADQSVVRTISAEDGGTATVTVSDIDIDLVGPTVTIKGVKAGKTYPKKKHPTCRGTDALSGLASCTITQVKAGRKYVVTATATDEAGNVTTATLTYKVKKAKKS
jgi:hypothetical protein